jgi:phage tail tape-measure protein
MRRNFLGMAAATALIAISSSGCVAYYDYSVQAVDPEDAVERAAVGSILGAALGASVGTAFALNPGLGALIGTEIGGGLGAVIGVATAQPRPDYAPISVPAATAIPGFYDTWPPGSHLPPAGSQTPPPRPG